MVTTLPSARDLSSVLVMPYYAIVPGYCLTLLLRETAALTQRIFYSISLSLVILLTFHSLTTLDRPLSVVPVGLAAPIFALVVLGYNRILGVQ